VTVTVNSLPSVSLTSPSSNASFKAPANIPLAVQVADADGSVANVAYFYGTTLITSLSAPPYSFVWTEVPQGTYALTARVTDNLGGVVTSVAVNVSVNAAEAKLYYIHVDHLNTPRLVADDQQRTVWRWDQQEPFGVNVPEENPSGLGIFELPLRLPGQYYDSETITHYNMMRDYAPAIGRYQQSDPIGLRAGVNTYLYVLNNPMSYLDPFGLVKVCYYYEAAGGFGHIGFGVGAEAGTYGYYPTGSVLRSPGIIKEDIQKIKECKEIPSNADEDRCMLECRARRNSDPGTYVLNSNQCTSFVRECLKICGLPTGGYPGAAPRPLYLMLPSGNQ
jgi:RHS repeat-associated protein